MSSFRARHATHDDAATVVALVRAFDEAVRGESDYVLADLEDEWRQVDPEQNAWLFFDGDVAVAFGSVDERGNPPQSDGYVHPAHFGRGLGTALVQLMEDELTARGYDALRTGVLQADEQAQKLLAGRGYREVRRFSQMRIELAAEPPQPTWPDGVTVSAFVEDDAEAFYAAYEDSFADHWGHTRRTFEEWRGKHLDAADFAPDLWAVVRDGDRIVAGSELIRERNGVAWVSRLFTVADWRRRGIGEALLHDAFGKFWAEGLTTVGLGVDATSETGANRLYERVGMHVNWGAVVFEKAL
jgi:ribosomal protein S18 acetylase RimI-like enzyme